MRATPYRLGLRAASASLFKAIAAAPDHAARPDALRSLLPLALELPSTANIEAPLLQYNEEARANVLEDLASPVRSRIRYRLGHFDYVNKAYRDAIAQFEKVEDGDLPRAQIMIAMCYVQVRKSVPAVTALERARKALASQAADPEARRLIEFANLLQARIFFSAAFRFDDARNVVVGNRPKLLQALSDFKKIDISSPFGLDALWERAWVELALGDQKAALSDFRSATSTPGAHVPEAEQMEINVRWGLGEKDAALESFRTFVTKYSAIQRALLELTSGLAKQTDADAAACALLEQAKDRPDGIPATVRLVVIHAFRDRGVLDALQYARLLEDERKRLETSPEDLRTSIAADRARRALEDERRALVRRSAAMVRSRLADEAENLQTLIKEVETALAPE